MDKLIIRVMSEGGTVRASVFAQALEEAVQLATAVQVALGDRQPAEWSLVGLRQGSAVAEMAPSIPVPKLPWRIVEWTRTALLSRQLSSTTPASLKALARLEHLTQLGDRTTVSISSDDETLEITREAVCALRESLGPTRRSMGTVSGQIESVTLHIKNEFSLYEENGRRIVCRFVPDFLQRVKEGLGRRAVVRGYLAYDNLGQVQALEVKRLQVLRDSDDLPSIDSMIGIFELDQPSDRLIRGIRDEQ